MLPSHPDHVSLSLNAHLPPQPCLFEPKCLSPTSTMPIWVWTFITHPGCVSQAWMLISCPNYVPSSPNAHLPPRPYLFEPKHLYSTLAMSIQARTLVFHPDHLPVGPNACLPSDCVIQALWLTFHLGCVYLSQSAHLPSNPVHLSAHACLAPQHAFLGLSF